MAEVRSSGSRVGSKPRATPVRMGEEDTSHGKTTISGLVVEKIAGIATKEITGVWGLGGGMSRAFGAMRERIPGAGTYASTAGVQVDVGEKQAAVDLDVIVDYGVSIVELARAVRRNVVEAIEAMTGLEVIEVNLAITDIHIDDDLTRTTPRVE